ncbi:hypothetical protein [Croceibacterium ferulae]|uniref:hypothetical protein n=1 Tax=Croceibacterium ferulae TaxID=1854641 RepID=UPI0012D7A2CE|nr:hypothetical protein [Croceibacterium ferulae]
MPEAVQPLPATTASAAAGHNARVSMVHSSTKNRSASLNEAMGPLRDKYGVAN